MTAKETAVRALEDLSERDLEEVSRHLKLLQLRARARARPPVTPEQLALYAEFAEEDRLLAEEGMADYAAALHREDEAA